MGINFSITLFVVCILFFICFLILGFKNYSVTYQNKYNVKNMFPYEINYQKNFFKNFFVNFPLVLSFVCYVSYFLTYSKDKNVVMISLIVLSIFAFLVALCLFLVPLSYLKTHMILTIFLFILSFSIPSLVAIYCFNTYRYDQNNYMAIIGLILGIISALFSFILIMNPKLSFSIPMQKLTDEKGNEYYARPKYIVVAFSQWLAIFNLLISTLPLLLLLFYK